MNASQKTIWFQAERNRRKKGPNLDCSFRGKQKFRSNSFLQVSKRAGCSWIQASPQEIL